MNIVVVTTNAVLPGFLARPLEPLGHRLRVVATAAALSAAVAEARPRAVFLPRRLPDAALADVVATLTAGRDEPSRYSNEREAAAFTGAAPTPPAPAAPPIATIIIGTDPGERRLARELGADGFLAIPFSDVQVLDVVGLTTRKKKLVLLADDSPMIHRYTAPILEDGGYEVVSAHDGAQALRLARERVPDLIITDIEMPKLDGYEVCKSLKQSEDTAHIPVLISSTLGEAADLERGFDAGADDYLVKPVVPEELLTRVRALCVGSMPASRERLLVVDDSPAQRHYVADCLARQGFEILTADNGRAGLDIALRERPAMVISDYEMPEMTGFELVHALKRDPDTRNIPVVMLTARDTKRDMAQMRAAGAAAYLVKPFAQDKCIATVERTLAEHRLLAYKHASSVYISEGARRAAEARAHTGEMTAIRADEREMAVVFTDIVGFTKLASGLEPREVIELLNDYFDVMCPLIVVERGDIDKFIGDAIMAVFEVLRDAAHPAERAVRAGLAMQAAMAAFNATSPVSLAMRIGINTGPLVRGDLGARVVRRDYTVIGDTVNRANRYETACPPGRVLISESTRAILGERVITEPLPGLSLKGVAGPVTGHVVVALDGFGRYDDDVGGTAGGGSAGGGTTGDADARSSEDGRTP